MTALVIIAGIAWLAIIAVVVWWIKTAPAGYQDADGYHDDDGER